MRKVQRYAGLLFNQVVVGELFTVINCERLEIIS